MKSAGIRNFFYNAKSEYADVVRKSAEKHGINFEIESNDGCKIVRFRITSSLDEMRHFLAEIPDDANAYVAYVGSLKEE